jgi:hypothetical protein
MFRTDFRDRGVPWMRLLLERRGRTAPTLNTGRSEQLRVGLAGLGVVAIFGSLLLREPALAWASIMIWLVLAMANADTYRWFARQRGLGFAIRVVPLHLAYYASNALAAATGIVQHLAATRPPAGQRG